MKQSDALIIWESEGLSDIPTEMLEKLKELLEAEIQSRKEEKE